MNLTRIQIQEKLLEEYSINGYISEKQIDEICDANNIDLFDIDKIIQFLVDRKVLIQNEQFNTDDDEGYDRSQIDYESIYQEILKRYPEQKYLIGELKKILPPQRNEWQTLLPQAKQGNLFARNRIISMYSRNLFRSAYNFSISFGSDINNSFEDAVEGLIKAINTYDLTSPQPFPGYYSFYVLAAMQRNYEKINSAYKMPNHHNQDLFQFLTPYKYFIEKYGIHTIFEYIPERKINELKEKNLVVYEYLQTLIEYDFNMISYDAKIPELCNYKNLRMLIELLLDTLPPREYEILTLRFGLINGKELTLDEIGQIFNVTRERIRQIEANALRRLRHPRRNAMLNGFYDPISSSLLLDDIYTRIDFIKSDGKINLEKNEFSDMSQGQKK